MVKEPGVKITDKEDRPLYPIGVVAELIGITDQTLRLYEKHGLIKPARRNRNRYYSENDLKWLNCIRGLIHRKKISIEGIKKLLEYAPCWEINQCPEEIRNTCKAPRQRTKPCWEINKMICKRDTDKSRCEDCIVFLAQRMKKAQGSGTPQS